MISQKVPPVQFRAEIGAAQNLAITQIMRVKGRNVKHSDVLLNQTKLMDQAKKWLGDGIIKLILADDDDGSLRAIILSKLKENQDSQPRRGRIDFSRIIRMLERVRTLLKHDYVYNFYI